jgi:hypothetical protein
MKRTVAFSLALCVLLAGCGGFTGGDTATPTDTSTPTDTPTPTPTPSADEYLASQDLPDGLTADGVDDVEALTDAHDERLDETGAESTLVVNTSGGNFAAETTTTARRDGDGTFRLLQKSESEFGNSTVEAFVADGPMFLEQNAQGQQLYSVFDSEYYQETLRPTASLEQYLRLGDFEVASVDRGEDPRVTLTADDVANTSDLPQAAQEIENVSGELVVGLDGTIRSLTMSYVAAGNGEQRVEIEFELEQTGVEDVEAPDWTETAREESTITDLSYDAEGGIVAITNEGGDPIPAASQLLVIGNPDTQSQTDPGAFFFASLNSTVEPGDTAYVYRTEEGAQQGTAVVGERPDVDAAPLPDSLVVQIAGPQGSEIIDITRIDDDEE